MWGVLDKSKRMYFHKFDVNCRTALVTLFINTYRSTMPFSRGGHFATVTTKSFSFFLPFLTLIIICKVKLKVPQFAQESKTLKDSDTRVV